MVISNIINTFLSQTSEDDVSQFDTRFTLQTPIDSPDESTLSESANLMFQVNEKKISPKINSYLNSRIIFNAMLIDRCVTAAVVTIRQDMSSRQAFFDCIFVICRVSHMWHRP